MPRGYSPQPNFLIAGAAKCGTSSLAQYVGAHPEAFIPDIKEPMFFVSSFYSRGASEDPLIKQAQRDLVVDSWDEYLRLFQAAIGKKAVGDASSTCLYFHQIAIPKIKRYLGDPKIIIVLRNPADRAFSAYCHVLRETGWEMTFEEFIAFEKERIAARWGPLHHAVQAGYFCRQVEAYIRSFSRVRIYLFDDLQKDPVGLIQNVFRFLEIDDSIHPDSDIKWNIGGVPWSRSLYRFLFKSWTTRKAFKPFLALFVDNSRLQRWKEGLRKRILKKPMFSKEIRRSLLNLYREDIQKLQDLIDRDLSAWFNDSDS